MLLLRNKDQRYSNPLASILGKMHKLHGRNKLHLSCFIGVHLSMVLECEHYVVLCNAYASYANKVKGFVQ